MSRGVFAKEVTFELNYAERGDFFQGVEERMVLAKALWLRVNG